MNKTAKHDSNLVVVTPSLESKLIPRVNCGKRSRRCVPLSVACDYLLRSAVGAHLWESERETYWVWGNQWIRATRVTTPHRVLPPVVVQVCRQFHIKHLKRIRKKRTLWSNKRAAQVSVSSNASWELQKMSPHMWNIHMLKFIFIMHISHRWQCMSSSLILPPYRILIRFFWGPAARIKHHTFFVNISED